MSLKISTLAAAALLLSAAIALPAFAACDSTCITPIRNGARATYEQGYAAGVAAQPTSTGSGPRDSSNADGSSNGSSASADGGGSAGTSGGSAGAGAGGSGDGGSGASGTSE